MYFHVVERREDGIVVWGAKAHQTGTINSRKMIVMPTISIKGDTELAGFVNSLSIILSMVVMTGLMMVLG